MKKISSSKLINEIAYKLLNNPVHKNVAKKKIILLPQNKFDQIMNIIFAIKNSDDKTLRAVAKFSMFQNFEHFEVDDYKIFNLLHNRAVHNDEINESRKNREYCLEENLQLAYLILLHGYNIEASNILEKE